MAEQFAEGTACEAERVAAHADAVEVYQAWYRAWESSLPDTLQGRLDRVSRCLEPEAALLKLVEFGLRSEAADGIKEGLINEQGCTLHDCLFCLQYIHFRDGKAESEAAHRRYAVLLREILGSPFRPVSVGRDVLAWNNGTVLAIAGGISRERRFQDLPILADALEEAGCTDPDILTHCRQLEEHTRGCWVVDLVTSKS
jgi:hypothetical protein